MTPTPLPTIRPSLRERVADWALAIVIGVVMAASTVQWCST